MKFNEIIRTIMIEQDVTVTKLADRIGKSSRLVCDRLAQDNISIEKLDQILEALDYQIIIAPKTTWVPDDSYKVELE